MTEALIMAAARPRQPPALDLQKVGTPYYGRRASVAASGTRFTKIGTPYYGRRPPDIVPGTYYIM